MKALVAHFGMSTTTVGGPASQIDRVIPDIETAAYVNRLRERSWSAFIGPNPDIDRYPDPATFGQLVKDGFDPYDIWRGIVHRWLLRYVNVALRRVFDEVVGQPSTEQPKGVWRVPEKFRTTEKLQRRAFQKIAGSWMGKDHRRGATYTWSVAHLADAKGRTSPRSFINAMKAAADDSSRFADHEYPLHYEAIKEGVKAASAIRLKEITEDHPWVESFMESLRGSNVPASFAEIKKVWRGVCDAKTLIDSGGLPPENADDGPDGIRRDLEFLGVIDRSDDGRVNIPDHFRVGFGIGRKGGVKRVPRR